MQANEEDDVVEIVNETAAAPACHPHANEVTLLSDSDSGDEQSIDVADDNLSLIVLLSNDDGDPNDSPRHVSTIEWIDLTEDESTCTSYSSQPFERKSSIDVQECPICLETLCHLQYSGVHLIMTPCRHVMCTLCSRQLLANSSQCPLCREEISSTTLMPYCILT